MAPHPIHYLSRWQTAQIQARLADRRVLLLAGARQCGKTTLARHLVTESVAYVTLDEATAREAAAADPVGFIERPVDTLIIDEIQRVPALLPAIKWVVDQNPRPGQFLLIGSTHLSAIPAAQESLAGRVAQIRLRPLSVGEVYQVEPTWMDRAFERALTAVKQATDRAGTIELAMAGGFPEVLSLPATGRAAWHRDYIEALLTRDLQEISHIERRDAMEKLLLTLAAWSSKPINLSDLGRDLSITRPTVESYLAALEALYLVERLPAFTSRDYERVSRKDKLFMVDSGLMASLLHWREDEVAYNADRLGNLIETFVYTQLMSLVDVSDGYRLMHYKDREKREIDFVVERLSDGAILAIEVKAAATVQRKDFQHIHWFQKNLAGTRPFTGLVLYTGQEIFPMGEGLQAVPISTLWSGS